MYIHIYIYKLYLLICLKDRATKRDRESYSLCCFILQIAVAARAGPS